jgi:hypothetical protein
MACLTIEEGAVDCPETSLTDNQQTLRNIEKNKNLIYTAAEA